MRGLLLSGLAFVLAHGALEAQRLTIRVNLPAYRLDVFRGEERIQSYPVAIGSARHQTPMGAWDVGFVEWNPWWHPPDSEWARGSRPAPPGPGNPMGRAKIQVVGLIFIHGSQAPLERAVSHGCIRLSNAHAQELARLVALESGAGISPGEVAALERSPSRTRQVGVPPGVRVEVVYRLVEEVDGEVLVHDDVYDFGMTAVERALKERGAAGRLP